MKEITKEWLEKAYNEEMRSFTDIAKQFNTYPNAIRRLAIKLGIKPRTMSEAQSQALKSGRHKHPTSGRTRSQEEKLKISEGIAKAWDKLSEDEYNQRIEQCKLRWEALSPEERAKIQKLGGEAVRKTAREGSQLEKFIAEHLKKSGFMIEFHKKGFVSNAELEVDLFLPGWNIAIEIDGPAHFHPIWGEKVLAQTMKADNEKNGLLLLYRINVIRVKQLSKNVSMKNMRDIAAKLSSTIDTILNKTELKADIYIVEV